MGRIADIFNTLEKSSIKWVPYFDVYERYLYQFVNKSPKIMEIGVLGGGSLELWQKYFGEGTNIVGVDITESCRAYENENVKIEIGDQGSDTFWDEVLSRHGNFDIVIDDGGHKMQQQILTLNKVWPKLNNGGIFIVEDTHTSYWHDWGGGYNRPESFLTYSKSLTDLVNKEHTQEMPRDLIESFPNMYSIAFYNSMVVFEKHEPEPFVCLDSAQRK